MNAATKKLHDRAEYLAGEPVEMGRLGYAKVRRHTAFARLSNKLGKGPSAAAALRDLISHLGPNTREHTHRRIDFENENAKRQGVKVFWTKRDAARQPTRPKRKARRDTYASYHPKPYRHRFSVEGANGSDSMVVAVDRALNLARETRRAVRVMDSQTGRVVFQARPAAGSRSRTRKSRTRRGRR